MATGLLLGPLIAVALLISGIRQAASRPDTALPENWLIEPPMHIGASSSASAALEAVVLSRRALVDLSTYCAFMLLINVSASWLVERLQSRSGRPEGERASVPRSEARRFTYYVLFTLGASVGLLGMRLYFRQTGMGIWQSMSSFEAVLISVFYPFTLYAGLRLAHRGFTVGELGLICFGGAAVCLECMHLTFAKVCEGPACL